MIDYQIILAIIFVISLLIFLIAKRKELSVQKIVFPLIFIILYRTKLGLKLMDSIAEKYRELVRLFGYFSIGIGFLGMFFISFSVLVVILKLILQPATSSSDFVLVLPFTNIPGIGFLPFTHWIIAIFVLAIIHEFAHGVVARAHNVPVKSSGFAILSVLLPIVPAAFVEPDEKDMEKRSDFIQYSILAAGPVSNLIFAFFIFLIISLVMNPIQAAITEPIGFTFDITNESMPASQAGLTGDELITFYNGDKVATAKTFIEDMYYCSDPGEKITFGNENKTYIVTAISHPEQENRGYIGINNINNEIKVVNVPNWVASVFFWLRDLFKWLLLLNFFIGLANLLPLGIVDGGRMLHTALHTTMKNKSHAQRIWKIIAVLFLFFLVFGLLVNYFGNPFLIFG